MLREFRDFIARGNVLDLAVAVIIGAAFATITASLTDDIIMPIVGAIFGGLDFSSYFTLLGPIPAAMRGRRRTMPPSRRPACRPRLGSVHHCPHQFHDPRVHHLPDREKRQQDDAQEGRGRLDRPRSTCSPKSATS
jgi:hypothetical protein